MNRRIALLIAAIVAAFVLVWTTGPAFGHFPDACGHTEYRSNNGLTVMKFSFHVWADGSYHNNTGNYHRYVTWGWFDSGLFDPGRWIQIDVHVRKCH